MTKALHVEEAVSERYGKAAGRKVETLCCPVSYDKKYLEILPREIIERDYGCGDPSAYLKPGETVLDLGSGGGKICYIAAQVVGKSGRVIGVDMNEEMLALARKHRKPIGDKLGYHNVEFRQGKIQDLRTDYAKVAGYLNEKPIRSTEDLRAFETWKERLGRESPLVADRSIDVIVSNCVLNLVRPEDKKRLFTEMFRVLKSGGRAVISDIVADEEPTEAMKNDPELWSGCISGAFQEQAFLKAFEGAGFHGMEILSRQAEPWRTVDGIEFRSVTVAAYKGKQGPCWELNQAVVYKGPWSQVKDDDHHTLYRGVPMAVCEKTFRIMTSEPYAGEIVPIEPRTKIELKDAKPFDCGSDAVRPPGQTKGRDYKATIRASESSNGNGGCPPGTCC